MWNNITHGNTNMNKFERLMEHRGHLERLVQIKKVINTKNPKTPSFISKKMINPGNRMERLLKIKYENKVLYGRVEEMIKKTSPYSACMNIPSKCPAFELLSHHRNRKKVIIKIENDKLFKRFTLARPTYNAQKLTDEYEYTKYIENNISKNRNRSNPNLDFITFEKFNKKIRNKSFYGKMRKMKKNLILNNSLEKSKSCYNSQKNIMPSLTVNHNKNEDWFQISCLDNNNPIEKVKLKRPNSCRPNIIINREIDNTAEIFNNEASNNISKKTFLTKPHSGKTRTNGSKSTNVMTCI
jgi:hypothetical protein